MGLFTAIITYKCASHATITPRLLLPDITLAARLISTLHASRQELARGDRGQVRSCFFFFSSFKSINTNY